MNRRQARAARRLAECVLDARAAYADYLRTDDRLSLVASQSMWPAFVERLGAFWPRVAAPAERQAAREEREAADRDR